MPLVRCGTAVSPPSVLFINSVVVRVVVNRIRTACLVVTARVNRVGIVDVHLVLLSKL
jgi:hypothetical protein